MTDIYIFSEPLQNKLKYSPENGLVTVNERNSQGKLMTYTLEEIQLIKDSGCETIDILHNIKKVFSGTITKKETENASPNN